jgi:L-asparaginase II
VQPAPLAVFSRGVFDESVHYGSIAVVDARSRLIASVGDPFRVTTMRSTAKPFQAMVDFELGAAERFAFTPAELAVIAGSHSGEPRHTETVRGVLARAGLSEDALQTGLHPPLHAATRAELERAGRVPGPLHHNCSGKHCGMLCACVHRDWDLRTYVRPDHPLQRAVLRLMCDVTGLPAGDVGVAIDGCGVPTFAVPLAAIAGAFARLARGENLSEEHQRSAARVRGAMLAHPEMVAGEGRFDTDLMIAARGRVLAKAGAEACYGVALPEMGWGVAVKIEDGGSRAVPVALVEALRQMDAIGDGEVQALAGHARPPVRNYRGEIVGEARSVFGLSRP